MRIEFKELAETGSANTAVVIVGSGAVGLFLGVKLAKAGRRVLLLESGDRDLGGFAANSYALLGRSHHGIQIGRSRSLGGTTNLWGGQLVEFMPADLQERSWPCGEAWPLTFGELAAYYPETYEALGVDRSLIDDERVWQRLGTPKPDVDHGLEVFLTRWMKVPNLATLYADEIERAPNLIVATGSTVCGLRFKGNRIDSVEVSDGRGGRATVAGTNFVLAAGTIENARLMLHAAASPECPWRDNRMLGRRFQDHLGGRIADIVPREAKTFSRCFSTIVFRGEAKLQPKIRTTNDTVLRSGQLNIQAGMAFESSVKENLVFLKQFVKAAVFSRRVGSLRSLARNVTACSRYLPPLMWNYIVQHRLLYPGVSKIALHVQSETMPSDDSRITVDRNVLDRYGLPKVLLDWRLGGGELTQIKDFATRVSAALSALADVRIVPELAAGNPDFLDSLYDTGHQVGGCIMGTSPENGVVDGDLRVFGTENVYVVGACVFRSSGNANTTFTAMTFASRLKDHLSKVAHPQH